MSFRIAIFAVAFSISSIASADWTVTTLHDPTTSSPSTANAVTRDSAFGSASGFATAWLGSSQLNWSQPGMLSSELNGSDGFDVVGSANFGNGLEAILFRGGPGVFIRLQNSKTWDSRAHATWGNTQVGSARLANNIRYSKASLWKGTAKSWKNLHPVRYNASGAYTIYGNQIGGIVDDGTYGYAAAWEGSNWRFRLIDSTPSVVNASNAAFYGGARYMSLPNSDTRAWLWSKSSNQGIDVSPPGAHSSSVTAMDQDKVAITSNDAFYVSSAWIYDTFNTVTPWTDLQAILNTQYPGLYSRSIANGIWRDTVNNRIRVVGSANGPSGRVAVLWEYNP